MSTLNPVIEAYLAGQEARSKVLSQATETAQKQQQLNDIMKRFGIETKLRQQEIDTAHQLASSTIAMHHAQIQKDIQDTINTYRQQVATGLVNPQTTSGPSTQQSLPGGLQLPGGMNIPGVADVNAGQRPAEVPNLSQNIAGLGPTNIPGLVTEQEYGKRALKTLAEQEAVKTEAYSKSRIPLLEMKLETQAQQNEANRRIEKAIADARVEAMTRGQDVQQQNAYLRARTDMIDTMLKAGMPIGMLGEGGDKIIGDAVRQHVLGYTNLKDQPPFIKNQGEMLMNSAGYANPPKDLDKVFATGTQATQLLNVMKANRTLAPPPSPTGVAGKISNMLAGTFGKEGSSEYKSQFDALTMSVLPSLEQGIGMTAGAMSRAPKLLDKIKTLLPLYADSQKVADTKIMNGTDLYLSIGAKLMSKVPIANRKIYWQKIVDDNPDLLQVNKTLTDKLIKAKTTGNYEAGSLIKELTDMARKNGLMAPGQ